MKKLFTVLLLTLACVSARAQLVTGHLTITNAPINTSTLTISGIVFTWTNGTPVGSQAMLITNTLPGDATNLVNVVGVLMPFQGVTTTLSNGTNVYFVGLNLAASVSASWASLTFTTNGNGAGTNVTVPMNTLDPSARTNISSQLVSDLNVNSTNAIDQNQPIAGQLVGLGNDQDVTGSKNFIVGFSGTAQEVTNGHFRNPITTNLVNNGRGIMSPGSGTSSEQFGDSTTGSAFFSTAVGDGASAIGATSTALGANATANADGSLAIGVGASVDPGATNGISIGSAVAQGTNAVAIGVTAITGGGNATAVGFGSSAMFQNSTAIGAGATTTTSNQVMLGSPTVSTAVNSSLAVGAGLYVAGNSTNLTATGTNTINAALVLTGYAVNSLVNSNNVGISIGTNAYVQVSGPSGAFFIASIAGGIPGRQVTIENSTGFEMVIGNQSGAETLTPANRILTGYSADRHFTNQPGTVTLWYDGGISRWKIIGVN